MRSVADRLFLATGALYGYVENKASLERPAEEHVWASLRLMLRDISVDDRLATSLTDAPGWMWLISDPNVEHDIVTDTIAFSSDASAVDIETTEWLLGYLGSEWLSTLQHRMGRERRGERSTSHRVHR